MANISIGKEKRLIVFPNNIMFLFAERIMQDLNRITSLEKALMEAKKQTAFTYNWE